MKYLDDQKKFILISSYLFLTFILFIYHINDKLLNS
jgi:hypothetical protein